MLVGLSIRNVVLIDELDLTFGAGLSVLTGETGTGKSILLDALGLALGARGDSKLVRQGRDAAVVTAAFEVAAGHPAHSLLGEQGLGNGDAIILRRTVAADGRSQALINDQRAGVTLLRQLGDLLVEVHGQFEQRGLLDPSTHRPILDTYAALDAGVARTRSDHRAWRQAENALATAEATADEERADESYLRAALEELELLDPQPGEEARLKDERELLLNLENLVEALNEAAADIAGERPVEDALRAAHRRLERIAPKAAGRLDPAVAALERATVEIAEASRLLSAVGADLDTDSSRLQSVDDRLFGLRDLARKHRSNVDGLPAVRDAIAARLAGLNDRAADVGRLRERVAETRAAYVESATELSQRRHESAAALDAAVAQELPPLKLDRARFSTRIEALDDPAWSADGMDRITFEVATNPGAAFGPLGRIASGGELSRFMLALKVVLARTSAAPTIVFDEVDTGIGGATAAAVGERLTRLSEDRQVLVVTHSPQVAARGIQHLRVEKSATGRNGGSGVVTQVDLLAQVARREEIARMLSGRDITDEARAAADVLIAGGRL